MFFGAKSAVDAKAGTYFPSERYIAVFGIAFSTFTLYTMLNSGVYHGHSRGRIFSLYADDWVFYLMLPFMLFFCLGPSGS